MNLPLIHIVRRVIQPDSNLEPISLSAPVKYILHPLVISIDDLMALLLQIDINR